MDKTNAIDNHFRRIKQKIASDDRKTLKKFILQICFSCLVTFYLITKIDWPVFIDAFKQINTVFYLLSTGMVLVSVYINSSKFYWLLKDTVLTLPTSRLMAINLMARYYSVFLPTSLGHAAVRWYKVTKNKQGKSFFLASTIVERLFFLLILVVCGTIPLYLYKPQNLSIVFLRAKLIGPLVATYIILFVLLIYFCVPRIQQVCIKAISRIITIKQGGKIDQFLKNFSLKNISPGKLGLLCLFSILWQFIFLIRIYLIFKATGVPLSFPEAVWIGSLVMLLQVLPVSFAGLGIREGAYAYFLALYGLPPEQGVINGLLFFSQMLLLAGIGAVLDLIEK